jgi:hypothetical protein
LPQDRCTEVYLYSFFCGVCDVHKFSGIIAEKAYGIKRYWWKPIILL